MALSTSNFDCVLALCALLLPAGALHVSASDKVSPLLQRQAGDLFLLQSLSSDAAAGALAAAGAGAGAARSSDGIAAATHALVMFGVLLAIAAALLLGALLMLMRSQQAEVPKPLPHARGKAGLDMPQGSASSLDQEFEHHAAGLASSACASLAGYECQSDATITDREDGSPSQRLVPLCPQLMVPTSSYLRVVVPELACRRRQDTFINICSVPSLGGSPLFRARVSECEPAACGARGVYLETLEGDQQFAWVSTEELWSSPGKPSWSPKLTIMRPDGLQFATMKKNNRGDYVIMCGLGILAVFSGDFQAHEAHVVSSQGRLMAQIQRGRQGCYEVTTSPDIDAGLIILGLLAIDKCERAA